MLSHSLISYILLSPAILSLPLVNGAPGSNSFPKIDFAALGLVGIAGRFQGLQLYDAAYEASLKSLNVSPDRQTLWSRSPQGALMPLGSTDPGGSISALCTHQDALYLAGNFTAMGNTTAANVAAYNLTTSSFEALGSGLNGQALSLYCGDDALAVGGTFGGPTGQTAGYAGSVASWSYSSKSWSPMPFGGLNGPVRAIEGSSDSTFFGGSFSLTISNGTSSSNTASNQISSLGSSLTPISLNTSYLWAGPTGSGDPYSAFCPEGDGQTGSAWLTPDDTAAIYVVRLYRPLQARGLRIGNTFQNGRGTRQFKVISVPDSIVQTFTYLSDPTNPSSPLTTCDWECPLSDNPSIPYQDFLFEDSLNITGFQIDVDQWYGAGGGLHQVSLLSDGAYSYAVDSLNGNSSTICDSGIAAQSPSSSAASGAWNQQSVPSNIEGVEAQVLTATVAVGSSASSSPSITFTPSIVANGGYEVYLLTPGCLNMGDCAARTSVDVVISTGTGTTSTTTISQQNQYDESSLVYSGALQAGATFQMRLAAAPSGSGSGGNYQLVAQKINLVAQNTDAAQNQPNVRGRNLFEYVPAGTDGTFNDGAAASSQSNVSSSAIHNATGFDLLSTSFTGTTSSVDALLYADSAIFFAGSFPAQGNISSANIAVYSGSSSKLQVPNGGLNGAVIALLDLDGYLYAAGNFTATSDNTVTNLNGVARWQYGSSGSQWQALTGGNTPEFTNGALGLAAAQSSGDEAVLVSGSTAGFSVYNTKSNSWDATSSSFFVGDLSTIASADADEPAYIAGSVQAALKYGASGIARLVTNSSGDASIVPYDFDFTSSASPATGQNRLSIAISLSRLFPRLLTFDRRAPPATSLTLPTPIDLSDSDQILAGAFYKNGSDYSLILGGQYVSNGVSNIGIYSTDANTLSSLNDSNSIAGTVQALKVVDNSLYIGGTFTTRQAGGSGFAVYDLKNNAWASSPPSLVAYDGSNVTVTSILAREDGSIIVAGAFSAAASLACLSICVWNAQATQWSALGPGLDGIVSSLDFAGDDQQYLLAAGNFVLNGETVSVARWDFQAASWSTLGSPSDLAGPATAISADDSDESNVFVAGGTTAAESVPYLMRWNGSEWSNVNNGALQSGSRIQQLAFLPLSANHDKNDIIESDRMLMVSGALSLQDVGTVSSALFDGSSFTPFISSATADGSAGTLASLFYSSSTFQLAKRFLSTGLVILISIAIGLGIVFLLVLIGLFFALRHRNSDHERQPLNTAYAIDEKERNKHRPTSLLATLNAATAMITADGHKQQQQPYDGSASSSTLNSSNHLTSGAIAMGEEPEMGDFEDYVRTRWSFDAENAGELSVGANEEVRILDRTDDQWWFVEKDDGKRGVVPSSYLF